MAYTGLRTSGVCLASIDTLGRAWTTACVGQIGSLRDSFGIVYSTGWHNGGPSEDPAGYGLKFAEQDRDRYFDPTWTAVVLILGDGPEVTIH